MATARVSKDEIHVGGGKRVAGRRPPVQIIAALVGPNTLGGSDPDFAATCLSAAVSEHATTAKVTWSARLDAEFARELEADREVLGLGGTTDLLLAGLRLLHQKAEEERMVRSVVDFHGQQPVPLPTGVRRSSRRPAGE